MIVVTGDVLRRQLSSIFLAWGMSPEHAETTVTVMVETDLTGVESHGVGMVPTYDRWFREGKINVRPNIRVERERDSVAMIAAARSLGHPPAVRAMQLESAKETGRGSG